MSYRKRVDIASKIGELLVDMTDDSLNKDEQDDLFQDVFEQVLRITGRFTIDVIDSMHFNVENWDEFLRLQKIKIK